MRAKKKLGIGVVGCGFMGRTHSNAFGKVNQFFDLEYQPVLTAVCARNVASAEAFAENWGFTSFETDWRKLIARADIDLVDIASPNDTHAEIAIAAAAGGQDGDVREAARAQRRRVGEDGRGRRIRRRAQHGLVQLSPRSRGHARQTTGRRGAARAHLSLSRQIPSGLDDFRRPAAGRRGTLAARRQRRRQRRHGRSAWPIASTRRCG